MQGVIWDSLSNPWRTRVRSPGAESLSLGDVLNNRLQRLSLDRNDERRPQPVQFSVQRTQGTQGTQGPVLNGCHIERFYNNPNSEGLHATPVSPTPTVSREPGAERMREEPRPSPQPSLSHERRAQSPTREGRAASPRPPNRDTHFIYDANNPRSPTSSPPPTRRRTHPITQSRIPVSVTSSGRIRPAERPLYNSDASIVANLNSASDHHENNTNLVDILEAGRRLHNPFSRHFARDGAFTRHFASRTIPTRNREATRNGVSGRRTFGTWGSESSTEIDLPSLNGPSRRRGQVDDEDDVTEVARSVSGGALVSDMPTAADDGPRCNGVGPGTLH
jgi:hypothetical protein